MIYAQARAYSIVVITLLSFLFVIMLANLNPKKAEEEAKKGLQPPGALMATLTWGDNTNHDDVDIWVSAPGEEVAVGYKNRVGKVWTLLRDDRGTDSDGPSRYENVISRSIEPGEYIINVHCYSCKQVPVKVNLQVQMLDKGTLRDLVVVHDTLVNEGQEITLIRFNVNSDKEPIQSSFNRVEKHLYLSDAK
jgi:hypothetical protein